MTAPLVMLTPDELRRVGSVKWSGPAGVIGMSVGETDVRLAQPVGEALLSAIRDAYTGSIQSAQGLFDAFAGFAHRRWGWRPSPSRMLLAPSIHSGVIALLTAALPPRATVAFSSPVYRPFRHLPARAGANSLDVPLRESSAAWSLDLNALAAAFARPDVRAYLLCSPHNPVGRVHEKGELAELAMLALDHDVIVVSDEVHAPLAHSTFTPFAHVSSAAAEIGWTVTSASKGWNLGGLGCAILSNQSVESSGYDQVSRAISTQLRWETSRLSVAAAQAAFAAGEEWLDQFNVLLHNNSHRVATALAPPITPIRMSAPEAGFLAWLDFRALEWGNDPSSLLRERARVDLSSGLEFGSQGAGHCRLNFGTSTDILEEALMRIVRLCSSTE